jgi:hypothetical protein
MAKYAVGYVMAALLIAVVLLGYLESRPIIDGPHVRVIHERGVIVEPAFPAPELPPDFPGR